MRFKTQIMILLFIFVLVLAGCAPAETMPAASENMDESSSVESTQDNTQEASEEGTSEESTDQDMEESSENTEGDMTENAGEEDVLIEMTLEELAKFNGKDGQPAYVAVDGVVYDVSHLDKWKTGTHMGQHEAGQDLSEAILKSPHGKKMLERATPVARLVE